MTAPADPHPVAADADDPGSLGGPLLELLEQIVSQVQDGVALDLEEVLAKHPEHAAQLRDLLPTILGLAEVGRAPAREPATPSALGEYRIVRSIGQGGMGVVYEAVQESLGRHVALKVLPIQATASPQHRERFRREAQAAARLHHTNIVPVFGVGEDRGILYYAMQFIDGQGLDAVLRDCQRAGDTGCTKTERLAAAESVADEAPSDSLAELTGPSAPLRHRRAAALAAEAADALHHAHQQGVLHRDVKPGNLLLDGRGAIWVTDFGLARVAGNETLTGTGDVVGTLRYLAPERFAGHADVRSDVYSLGLTLYELLTLRPAFDEPDRARLVERITHANPPRPRQLDPAIPRDLETIVLKAIDREPERRYATAEEMAEDLRRFLADQPIRARPLGMLGRLAKWGRRRPAVAALTVALALACLVLLALGVSSYVLISQALTEKEQETNNAVKAREQESQALVDRTQALRAEQTANKNLAEALRRETKALKDAREQEQIAQRALQAYRINLADREWGLNNIAAAEQALDECLPKSRLWEWHYLKRLCHKDRFTIQGDNQMRAVAYFPDGKHLVCASLSGKVTIRNADTGAETLSLDYGAGKRLYNLALSRDGRHLACSGVDGPRLWEARTGERLPTIDLGATAGRAAVLAFSPDGERLAAGLPSPRPGEGVGLWEVKSGKLLRTFRPKVALPSDNVSCLAFSPDGKRLAVSGTSLRLWDADRGEELLVLKGHAKRAPTVAFSPDGRRLASVGTNHSIQVWEVESGKELASCQGHVNPVNSVAFSPDGRRLASGGVDRTVRLWDAPTGQELLSFRGHRETVTRVAFHPDGRHLASSSTDSTVKVWDTLSPDQEARVLPHGRGVISLSFSPDSKHLAAASAFGQGAPAGVKVWDVERVRETHSFPSASTVSFSADGRQLICSFGTKVWDLGSGNELPPLSRSSIVWSSDGKYHAGLFGPSGVPNQVRIWEAASRKEVMRVADPESGKFLLFSPDGQRLASINRFAGHVKVWERASGKLLLHVREKPARVCAAFSPNGRLLACGLEETTPLGESKGGLRLWDVGTGRLIRTFAAPTSPLSDLAFSPDGKRLAGASSDATVKVWNVETGEVALTLRGHKAPVLRLLFSPDGRLLASASTDGTVRVWDATPLP